MKKISLVLKCLVFCFCWASLVLAEDKVTTVNPQNQPVVQKGQPKANAGKRQAQTAKKEFSKEFLAARAEEDKLKEQIKAAEASGDQAKVRQLKEQLRLAHQKSMQALFANNPGLQKFKNNLKSGNKNK